MPTPERTPFILAILIEQMDAERVEAMIKLAQLRNVTLSTIIQEFLPNSHTSHAV